MHKLAMPALGTQAAAAGQLALSNAGQVNLEDNWEERNKEKEVLELK